MSEIWDKIWQQELVEWDNLSAEIYRVLKREIGNFSGKRILDAGSGSGRISLRLALEGAEVTLLDYSDKALEVSQKYFNQHGAAANFIKADLTKPLPFKESTFDIVWNGGVMEHFRLEDQIAITKEFSRVAKEFHTFNPNAQSFFYRLGKWVAESANIWRYGVEYPVKTMKHIFEQSDFTLQKEYSIAHMVSLDFLVYLNGGNNVAQAVQLYLQSLDEQEQSGIMEQMGGYLLYSKGCKELK
ncbi:class I SAM-dependent methyltransferase [Petroclostridium sp. X23]|uniref:class I SAM-dependent methyltransferase n=1 Tax=Petroclostridium sp. X23 TaxID=3045146 RepID=UPI0024AD8C97|nr:class I SAM-dependent methyltransferase [Petroclostridium sp. X23]WHH58251.1 class I SAM-dependent methyltransferase [Petroclostridium sp. X23]